MKKENFKKPDNTCRPMRLRHEYNFKDCADREARDKRIGETIALIKSLGYGGVTINTPFENYLKPLGWEDFESAVKDAILKDMRIWIYDEKGYPSGTAGGRTLENHPEYEAKALVSCIKKYKAGDIVKIKKPMYHDSLVAAYAFRVTEKTQPDCKYVYSKEEDLLVDGFTGSAVDLMKYATKDGGIKWNAGEGFYGVSEGESFAVCVYWNKRLFERTHACQNFHETRRYLSVISKEAVGEFIKNTYEEYKKHAGKHFGKEIEAFFTDEPSLMAGYLDGTVHPPKERVKDEPHEDIPILPDVQWENFLPDEFRNRYGYGLMDNLHYLFAGTGKRAVKVRYDFNLMITTLYEEAYYGQIEKFCHDSGVKFSGHVLMEEYLLHHGIWEGNIFRIMSHMDIPGIDVLTTLPEEIIDMAVTPKLVSSASEWFGKKHTMSEISAHSQNFFHKVPYGAKEMKACAAAQYVMGVDIYQSYFGENQLENKEYNDYTDFIARIGEAIKGGSNAADIILYYPIEGVLSAVKGSDKFRESREYSDAEIKCEASWNGLAKSLMRNRLDYIMADAKAIENLYTEEDEEGTYLVNPVSGGTYKAIIVPSLIATDSAFLSSLADYASEGVKIIFDSLRTDIPSIDGNEDLKDVITDLLSSENVINCSADDIPVIVNSLFVPQLETENDTQELIYTKRCDADNGLAEVYLLTNTGKNEYSGKILLNVFCDFDTVYTLDPENGAVKELSYTVSDDGRICVDISVGALGTVIIGVE